MDNIAQTEFLSLLEMMIISTNLIVFLHIISGPLIAMDTRRLLAGRNQVCKYYLNEFRALMG